MALEIFCLFKMLSEAGSLAEPMHSHLELHQGSSMDGMRIETEMSEHCGKCVFLSLCSLFFYSKPRAHISIFTAN